MSRAVEERLRRALAQQASATTTSPDAWVRIRERADRRPALLRRTLLVPPPSPSSSSPCWWRSSSRMAAARSG